MKWLCTLTLLFSCLCLSFSNDSFLGAWEARIEDPSTFNFKVDLSLENDIPRLFINGRNSRNQIPLFPKGKKLWKSALEQKIGASLSLKDENPVLFIQIGHHLCAVELAKEGDSWKGNWNVLLFETGKATLLLNISKNTDGSTYASGFFEEATFHYLFCEEFEIEGNQMSFRDIRSQLRFTATAKGSEKTLSIKFLNEELNIPLRKRPIETWRLGEAVARPDGLVVEKVDNPLFRSLQKDIENDTLMRTHSVVISKQNKIIFEDYFDGFSQETLHDTRSLAKSFASTMIGFAIEDGLLENESVYMNRFLKKEYPNIDWSKGKDSITLKDLMTMSSGLDVIDFGLNRMSYANEGSYQSTKDWTRHILEAPMVNRVGEVGNYGSGSPHLLGPILESVLDEPLEFYIHRKLFQPLGINNYRIQLSNNSKVYFGGGWYLRPRDILKFGNFYLNEGRVDGGQMISKDWISKSLAKHSILDNTFDKNAYGYLFWHKTYMIKNKNIESIEARGSGGQYLFIIPELELTAVIMSGNYTNNKAFQPERIMSEYILPQLVE